jgi:peptidoglycan/xylan/chitin deacetylase (PgdA/CDA1 family)
MNVLVSALPTTLPPQSIVPQSIGPAIYYAEVLDGTNQRLQRRRTRRQPDWEEEEEEQQQQQDIDDDRDTQEEEEDYDDDENDTEEEDERPWDTVQEPSIEDEQEPPAPVQQEARVRVASATVQDTSTIVEDTTPVTAAVFKPDMRQGIDYSKVPAIAPKPVGSGLCPGSACAPGDCERCWETCGNCPRKDDYYGCKDKSEWSLTFDDGPSPYTDELLDTLKEKNVRATFFVLGGQVAKYPDVVRRMYREGHEIASHTWSHPHLMSLTDEQIIAEIKQTEDLIASLTDGHRPRYIRPPYGEADDRVKAIIHAHGLQAVLWNMDTLDYSIVNGNQDPQEIVQAFGKVVASGASALNPFNNPGFMSLQHDIYLKSVEQEQDIIDMLVSKGFKMVTVSQCTGDGHPYKNMPKGSSPVQPVDSNPVPGTPVQPANSNPIPGTPVQPGNSNAVPGTPVMPEGAASVLPPDSTVGGASEPHAKQLNDNAKQPAGGFLATYNEPTEAAASSASSPPASVMAWSWLLVLLTASSSF